MPFYLISGRSNKSGIVEKGSVNVWWGLKDASLHWTGFWATPAPHLYLVLNQMLPLHLHLLFFIRSHDPHWDQISVFQCKTSLWVILISGKLKIILKVIEFVAELNILI